MEYAILHTATGVVRRVTVDPNHPIGPDETRHELTGKISFDSGRPKIVGGVTSLATAQEIDDADKLPFPPEIQAIRQAAQAVINDVTVPQAVKDFVSALRVLYRQSRIGLK